MCDKSKNREYSFTGIRILAEGTRARKTIFPVFDFPSTRTQKKEAVSLIKKMISLFYVFSIL